MSVARALVFAVNVRFLLAAGAVAGSVMYALVAGSSVAGLRSAEQVLQGELPTDQGVYALPGLAPFRAADAPSGTTLLLVRAPREPVLATTRTPWPFTPGHAVPGPLADPVDLSTLGLNLTLDAPRFVDGAPGDWTLIPPDSFDRLFPGLAGEATVAVGNGSAFLKAPAADRFYATGAAQVTDGLAFVDATSVFVASVVAAVAIRLEVRARGADYAIVEALGRPRLARWLVVARGAFTVAVGVAVGTLAALASFAYLNRSQARLHLAVPAAYAWGTILAVGLVAAAVAAFAGVRSLRGDLSSKLARRGLAARRFRGPIRFLLVTPRLALIFAVALMATTVTVGVVLGAVQAPQNLLDPGRGGGVVASDVGDPLRGSVPRFAAAHADLFPDVGTVSPEVYAPTTLGDEPVMVRGVHFPGWTALSGATLTEGDWPHRPGEIAAGVHAAARFHLHVGDHLRLPGAYRTTFLDATVRGVFASKGLEADELLVGLDDASSLARLDPHYVHLIRIAHPTNATSDFLLVPRVQVIRLTLTPDPPSAGLPASVRADLLNTADQPASRTLTLRVNGDAVASSDVHVDGHAFANVTFLFTVPPVARLSIHVNPSLEASVNPATLRVVAGPVATLEGGAQVRVYAADGSPARNVTLTTPWGTSVAPDGVANLTVGAVGPFRVQARTGDAFGGASVFATKQAWLYVSHLQVERITVRSAGTVDSARGAYDGVIDVVNLGGATDTAGLVVNATGPRLDVPTNVPPFSEAHLAFHGEAPYGPVHVESQGATADTVLTPSAPPPAPEAPSVRGAIRAKHPAHLETAESRTQRFLNDVFQAVDTAVSIVVLATLLLGAVVVAAAVVRETAERAEVVQTLRALGATDGQVRVRAARDALLAVAPGLLLGLLLTPAAFWVGGLFNLPQAFGHRIAPVLTAEVLLRVSALLVLVAVLSALAAVRDRRPEAAARRRVPLAELTR